MTCLSKYHHAKCGVEGKCSVPMFSACGPADFCDRPAWGEQYSDREPSRGKSGKYAPPHWSLRDRNGYLLNPHLSAPFAPALCCDHHGGPAAEAIRFVMDGNMWCAFMPGFVNLQESVAGFGPTQDLAEADLRKNERAEA